MKKKPWSRRKWLMGLLWVEIPVVLGGLATILDGVHAPQWIGLCAMLSAVLKTAADQVNHSAKPGASDGE